MPFFDFAASDATPSARAARPRGIVLRACVVQRKGPASCRPPHDLHKLSWSPSDGRVQDRVKQDTIRRALAAGGLGQVL